MASGYKMLYIFFKKSSHTHAMLTNWFLSVMDFLQEVVLFLVIRVSVDMANEHHRHPRWTTSPEQTDRRLGRWTGRSESSTRLLTTFRYGCWIRNHWKLWYLQHISYVICIYCKYITFLTLLLLLLLLSCLSFGCRWRRSGGLA